MKAILVLGVLFLGIGLIVTTGCEENPYKRSPEKKYSKPISRPTYAPPTPGDFPVCDKFQVNADISESILTLSLDTDMPDYARIMIGIKRTYWENENPDKYSLDYFSGDATVSELQAGLKIPLDNSTWRKKLKAEQERCRRLEKDVGPGFAFTVRKISDDIAISIVVPVNQPDRRFGERNKNLSGKAVEQLSKGGKTGLGRVVGPAYGISYKAEINYPLD